MKHPASTPSSTSSITLPCDGSEGEIEDLCSSDHAIGTWNLVEPWTMDCIAGATEICVRMTSRPYDELLVKDPNKMSNKSNEWPCRNSKPDGMAMSALASKVPFSYSSKICWGSKLQVSGFSSALDNEAWPPRIGSQGIHSLPRSLEPKLVIRNQRRFVYLSQLAQADGSHFRQKNQTKKVATFKTTMHPIAACKLAVGCRPNIVKPLFSFCCFIDLRRCISLDNVKTTRQIFLNNSLLINHYKLSYNPYNEWFLSPILARPEGALVAVGFVLPQICSAKGKVRHHAWASTPRCPACALNGFKVSGNYMGGSYKRGIPKSSFTDHL